MGENGCFGKGSTPAKIAVTSSCDLIIFELEFGLLSFFLAVSNLSLIDISFTIRDHQQPPLRPQIFRSFHRPTMHYLGASQNGPLARRTPDKARGQREQPSVTVLLA